MEPDEVIGKDGRRLIPWCYRGGPNDARLFDPEAPIGLGYFVLGPESKQGKSYATWYYVPPNRPVIPVQWGQGHTPPPLPKPGEVKTRDKCGACGGMTWVELWGCADGYCTRCYYNG